MIIYDRPVRFEDVDAAGIVFFARFFGYCHDAMERFFVDVPGGYVALINERKVGFPAVHASSDFKAPLGYGDVARIEGTVTKLGTTASHFRFLMTRARDGVHVATMNHVHVCTDLRAMTKLPFPADVRASLEKHLVG
ncbi:MAG: thioesterase family protein [Polyangiaceae bacterium]